MPFKLLSMTTQPCIYHVNNFSRNGEILDRILENTMRKYAPEYVLADIIKKYVGTPVKLSTAIGGGMSGYTRYMCLNGTHPLIEQMKQEITNLGYLPSIMLHKWSGWSRKHYLEQCDYANRVVRLYVDIPNNQYPRYYGKLSARYDIGLDFTNWNQLNHSYDGVYFSVKN